MNAPALETPLQNMLKEEALQTMVHDLRTPIAVIKGNLMILLSGMMGQLPSEQKILLERSMGPLEEMLQMTDNLLQVGRLEAESMAIDRHSTNLDQLLFDTIEFYDLPFRQRQMRIFRDGNTLGVRLNVDSFWIKRVLHNLIWNAYKYTADQGQVSVEVQHEGRGIEVAIIDNGCGIPEFKRKSIFEKFGQVDVLRDRKIGTGLGLWICKRVLELHGGSIRCETNSAAEHGSRFVLSFPPSCVL